MKSPRYLQTIDDVAAQFPREDSGFGVDRAHAIRQLKKWGIEKGRHGWDMAEIMNASRQNRRGKLAGDGSLKDEKTLREIKLLDIEIDERMGKLKPQDEWTAEIRELVALNRAGLDQWLAWIAAELRNPVAYKKAKETVRRLCVLMQERTDDATEKNG